MRLERTDNLDSKGDDIYAALLSAHEGLDAAASVRLNIRLLLLLINHVGNVDVIREAIDCARATSDPQS